ncbi:MAG TPA: hypothetical protein VMP11_19770 [Verrucomicrobiae bacterium]|nr:hypothetical protein [Verrucomicrobiae bacterium]
MPAPPALSSILVNRHGHRRADWSATLFFIVLAAAAMSCFVICWTYGPPPPGSWRYHLSWLNDVLPYQLAALSFLTLIGFAVVFWIKRRTTLAAVALVAAASLVLFTLSSMPAF